MSGSSAIINGIGFTRFSMVLGFLDAFWGEMFKPFCL